MLKRNYILFGLLFSGALLFAQNKENKKQIKELLKEAQISFDIEDHLNAWNSYRRVLLLDPKNEKAGVNSAISFFKLNYSLDSAQFFIPSLTSSTLVDAKYYLAKIKHQQKNFEEAIQLLTDYNKVNPKKRLHTIEETNYMIGVCESAKAFINKPHRSIIKNMGPEINSTYADYVPVVVPDENTIYFKFHSPAFMFCVLLLPYGKRTEQFCGADCAL